MLVKITLFAALLLSIVVPFAYFLSGTKNKARYKLTIGTNAAAFFGIMLVACGFMFSGNAQAAEAAAEKTEFDVVMTEFGAEKAAFLLVWVIWQPLL